jgi:hypothetical protein
LTGELTPYPVICVEYYSDDGNDLLVGWGPMVMDGVNHFINLLHYPYRGGYGRNTDNPVWETQVFWDTDPEWPLDPVQAGAVAATMVWVATVAAALKVTPHDASAVLLRLGIAPPPSP